jgi:hypothetical protein
LRPELAPLKHRDILIATVAATTTEARVQAVMRGV